MFDLTVALERHQQLSLAATGELAVQLESELRPQKDAIRMKQQRALTRSPSLFGSVSLQRVCLGACSALCTITIYLPVARQTHRQVGSFVRPRAIL